ncbi:YbjN domain-containing protein [Kribbella sp. NBC_00662]|uniref:YbjN domain-containing protein n=1 Tax=Kribbella sp. NBC_00662 TaxID=2975969 RepID=UPI0032546987
MAEFGSELERDLAAGDDPAQEEAPVPVPPSSDPVAPDTAASQTELVSPTPAAPARVESEQELQPDYYVTLQPLTLELVARQMERIDITFSASGDALLAHWESFTLRATIGGTNTLCLRALLRKGLPTDSLGALAARCNWWNSRKMFLKASVAVVKAELPRAGAGAESDFTPAASLQLDCDLPFRAGVAPVQLQALLRDVIDNVSYFEEAAALDDLMLNGTWR